MLLLVPEEEELDPEDALPDPLDEPPLDELEDELEEPDCRGAGCGAGSGAGAGEASDSIVPTPVSEWIPRTGCSEAVGAGRATDSPAGCAALSDAGAEPPSAGEVSPTEMPARACGASSIEGSSARPITASATTTMIPRVRRIFMSIMFIAADERPVKPT
ncbi:hypothetical protein GCM10023160_27650 [Brachybacterium paraconglomeratum]